jgi:hypothetical protein
MLYRMIHHLGRAFILIILIVLILRNFKKFHFMQISILNYISRSSDSLEQYF